MGSMGVQLGHQWIPKLRCGRWMTALMFSFMSVTNGMLWMATSPVADLAEEYYGVDADLINFLPTIGFLSYIPAAPVTLWLLHNRDLREVVCIGAVLNAIGGAMRFGAIDSGRDSYDWLVGSAAVVGVATTCLSAAVTKVSATWFEEYERTTATSVMVLANTAGMALGYFLAPLIIRTGPNEAHGFFLLQIIEGGLPFVGGALVILFFHNGPIQSMDSDSNKSASSSIKEAATSVRFWIMAATFAIVTAVSWTLQTVLNETMSVHGYSDSEIDVVGSLFIVMGVPGMLIAGVFVDKTRAFKLSALVLLLLSCGSLLGYTYAVSSPGNYALIITFASVSGFAMSALSPLLLEMVAECTHPIAESTTTSIMFLMLQCLAAAFVQIDDMFESRFGNRTSSNLFFSIMVMLCTVAVALTPMRYLREEAYSHIENPSSPLLSQPV